MVNATRYADALQWDANGSLILFDSFNSLPGPDGESIDFWDIKTLDPTNEIITSWSPPLPPGLHLANPSFSTEIVDGRMNDCRLLYEVINENFSETVIVVWNRCTGESAGLYGFSEDVYSFPRFINNDREIVFEFWTGQDEIYTSNLWRLPLSEDRLSAAANQPSLFLAGQQSPHAFMVEDESGLRSTAVETSVTSVQPAGMELAQNYPNPFNPETNIRFQLSAAAKVSLKIFDLHGQNIVTLSNGFRQAGSYNVMWDGKNAYGKSVASGVYFYRLSYFGESGEQSLFARKMLLLR